jgi:hypothetical protein
VCNQYSIFSSQLLNSRRYLFKPALNFRFHESFHARGLKCCLDKGWFARAQGHGNGSAQITEKVGKTFLIRSDQSGNRCRDGRNPSPN